PPVSFAPSNSASTASGLARPTPLRVGGGLDLTTRPPGPPPSSRRSFRTAPGLWLLRSLGTFHVDVGSALAKRPGAGRDSPLTDRATELSRVVCRPRQSPSVCASPFARPSRQAATHFASRRRG